MKIKWIDLNIVIDVEEKEKVGHQTKFYGECIRANDEFWLHQMVETPFLYKSGYEVIK